MVKDVIIVLALLVGHGQAEVQPNIVFIVSDDLGFADVGWNNPKMENVSKHITELAREGVILNQYYVQPRCSPSR